MGVCWHHYIYEREMCNDLKGVNYTPQKIHWARKYQIYDEVANERDLHSGTHCLAQFDE